MPDQIFMWHSKIDDHIAKKDKSANSRRRHQDKKPELMNKHHNKVAIMTWKSMDEQAEFIINSTWKNSSVVWTLNMVGLV